MTITIDDDGDGSGKDVKDVDLSSVYLQLGSKNYAAAAGATDACTAELIAGGKPCAVRCDANNTNTSLTTATQTTCSILGDASMDVTEYFMYTAAGQSGLDNCPNDDPSICPYLFVLARDEDEQKQFGMTVSLDFTVGCDQKPCDKHFYNSTKTFSCNQDDCRGG